MTPAPVASLSAVTHRYGSTLALSDVTLDIPAGCMAGLIGPDGVGKSTLLALIAGVRKLQAGGAIVLGGDITDRHHLRACNHRIAYMPQGLGRNLYPTLSVYENLDFFGRLFGQSEAERRARINNLLTATGLDPFPDRPAGKLSGGMKQKLSLCSALIHDPDLVILDEPTTGVDPLSRQQFWDLIDHIREERPAMSVIVATAYMEEAERFDWLAAMNAGQVISTGSPIEIRNAAGQPTLEKAFIAMLPEADRQGHRIDEVPPRRPVIGPPAIEAKGLTCRFGDFIAVDHVEFQIEPGEIFGFLGSNGCGKTTTMKMLTGLQKASEGKALLFGEALNPDDMATRRQVGYMSQSFSLYGELTVRQNLELHARLYQLPIETRAERVAQMLHDFDLAEEADKRPDGLPLGIRQRLQLAVAVIHSPEVLILDEPTSGVDPVARDGFWRHLIKLSRDDGVTIFVSTHFMNEAARCDRISLMHAGKVLAVGTPEDLARSKDTDDLEEAFVGYLREAAGNTDGRASETPAAKLPDRLEKPDRLFDLARLWAFARRESIEILRDPMRLAFAFLGPVILMLTFGYGISFDVQELPYAVLDRDKSAESRNLMQSFSGSRYFVERPAAGSVTELDIRMRSSELVIAVEVPPGFGKSLLRGDQPEVRVAVDGAMPFRAETTRGYLQGLAASYMSDQTERLYGHAFDPSAASVETRFRYNQAFKSVFALIPSVIMLMLVLIPAMMAAMGVVREKETGSIANFRSTPVTRTEFILGKQLPYVAIAMLSFASLIIVSYGVFGVLIKGSVLALLVGTLLYVLATTGFGVLVSTFTRTQVAATFAAAVISIIPAVNFSGLLVPVSSLSGGGRLIGLSFPSSWYQQISMGTFTKGLGFPELWLNHVALAGFAALFIAVSVLALNKQET
ncbi:ribosome-associated ATPase/putative transporter RbbA [Ruegeria pomeroyi]|uniref:ABC transporter, ATP binding/permease protein n=2 Tax=Ruegeria pomeroyi TaxID=89184 RepID=Q5LWQ5_RUEPO|nr:ribosome-associated ATPase/putative transporter RbbA [Ruegeria pomeroyi]HCE71561.1 ABC transporter ATP-binding protein/permease [Ruegeria sp.]AAV93440.1 ABC transporter, ATP binding/permease protein [Ruegeria pomeroyi DSS-3]NVK99070.1 ribosome-associated ATPase/putative transporter RbbA [Ruegeria pomeroyi]NVL03925.1 ribosome-associated ATPase/putative transporter RbbA [Ruegeria pomeroyi]QWV10735.1 ribosome-associated ATPase/putative transporter RbbA [Ruegeria pomeroyi]